MAEITSEEVREFLRRYQGQEVTLHFLRGEFKITPDMKSFDTIRTIMWRLADQKIVKVLRKGVYKVITEVKPVQVFSVARERRPPVELIFPRNFDTMMEMDFAENVVIREGDLVLISGQSNFGKTALCINFCGENIDQHPVLMGNEYTTVDHEPTPRFMKRLDDMSEWIEWVNGNGDDKFTLLPVREDYAEHIIKDRINIIDWINLPGEYYMISPIMEGIKREIGRGIGIIALQKNEGTDYGRGGAMTKDFADCEILLDKFGESEVLLTVGKVKEYVKPVTGKTFAFAIYNGVKILNFREVKKCSTCYGKGYTRYGECDVCSGKKFVDK